MRWSHAAFLVGLTIEALACSDPTPSAGPILIEASRPTPREVGAVVTLTIRNLSGDRLQYSPCAARLERQGATGTWTIAYEYVTPCQALLESLRGRASRKTELTLPTELAPGSYRVRFPMIGALPDNGDPLVVAAQIGGTFVVEQ
jgi:hypothetical protein